MEWPEMVQAVCGNGAGIRPCVHDVRGVLLVAYKWLFMARWRPFLCRRGLCRIFFKTFSRAVWRLLSALILLCFNHSKNFIQPRKNELMADFYFRQNLVKRL